MGHRPQQVGTEIQRGLGQIILHEMPFERYGLITITGVIVTPNMESAKVFVSSLKNDHDIVDHLNKRAKWFGNELKKKIQMRRLPELLFRYDLTAEEVERLDTLMRTDTSPKKPSL